MKRFSVRPALVLALVLCGGPGTALAEPDSFGLGDGPPGALTVMAAGTVVTTYTVLTGPRLAGDTTLPVSSITGFAPGDLVLILQTTGVVPTPASGGAGP